MTENKSSWRVSSLKTVKTLIYGRYETLSDAMYRQYALLRDYKIHPLEPYAPSSYERVQLAKFVLMRKSGFMKCRLRLILPIFLVEELTEAKDWI